MTHPQVDMDPKVASVCLAGFGESSLDVEISCHVLTKELTGFRAIRGEILLRVMHLVTESGTALAMPSRALYMTQDQDEVRRGGQLGTESESLDHGHRAA